MLVPFFCHCGAVGLHYLFYNAFFSIRILCFIEKSTDIWIPLVIVWLVVFMARDKLLVFLSICGLLLVLEEFRCVGTNSHSDVIK